MDNEEDIQTDTTDEENEENPDIDEILYGGEFPPEEISNKIDLSNNNMNDKKTSTLEQSDPREEVSGAVYNIITSKQSVDEEDKNKIDNFLVEQKKTIVSLDFLVDPSISESPLGVLNHIENIMNKAKDLLRNYPKCKNKNIQILEIKKNIDKVSFTSNTMYSNPFETDKDSVKLKFAKMCLKTLIDINKKEDEDVQLLFLYMELVVEYGWDLELKYSEIIIQDLLKNKIFPNSEKILITFVKLLKIAVLMIDLRISRARYELKYLLKEYENQKSFEERLSITAFKLLAHAYTKPNQIFSVDKKFTAYSYDFCLLIGKIYISNIGDLNKEIWDVFNYRGVFLDIIHFERDNFNEIINLLEIFKTADFKTQQAISHELKAKKSITSLLNKFKALSDISKVYNDTSLLYSEIYFTEGKDTEWIGSLNGIGYLIIRYDEGWVTLYNTQIGDMTREITGTLFDAKHIGTTPKNLYFKLKKRDGWHLFKTHEGLVAEAWENIEFLSLPDLYQNQPKYILCKKDKTFSLFEAETNKSIKIPNDAQEIKLVVDTPNVILGIKISGSWRLFNASAEKFIDIFPQNIQFIENVKRSKNYLILKNTNKQLFLYDIDNNSHLLLKGNDKIYFSTFNNVLGKNKSNKTFFSIANCEHKIEITPTLFKWLEDYDLEAEKSLFGVRADGIGIFEKGTVVRYDFGMEFQGRYHITKKGNECSLWLHNTVGGGRTVILYEHATNIQCLGVSQELYNDRKVFFLIEAENTFYLYVSYYSQLKSLSDNNKHLNDKLIPFEKISLQSNVISFLHRNYLKICEQGCYKIYEHAFGYHDNVQPAEEIEPLDYRNYLKLKINHKWVLYELSTRKIISIMGAKSIEVNSQNKIVFIYDNYIRYWSFDDIPHCADSQVVSTLSKKIEFHKESDNYVVNLLKLGDYRGLNVDNYNQPFAKLILSLLDYQLLKQLNTSYIQKIMELFDGKVIDFTKLNKLSLELQGSTTVDEIESKKKVRQFLKLLTQNNEMVNSSFGIRKETIENYNTLKNQLSKIIIDDDKKFPDFKSIIQIKNQQRNKVVNIFENNRHLLSSILRYWMSIDVEAKNFDILYRHLIGLINLFDRMMSLNDEIATIVIQKHSLNIIRLYDFDADLINNYIVSIICCLEENSIALDKICDFLALLDVLTVDAKEKEFFIAAKKLGDSLQPLYEKLSDEKRQIEDSRIKEQIQILMLMAVSAELKNKNIYDLKLETYKNLELSLVLKDMAKEIWKYFYKKIGINPEKFVVDNIPIAYLPDILYAHESFALEDKLMLLIMLKAIIYNLNLKTILLEEINSTVVNYFSKTEQKYLKKLQDHNTKVIKSFNGFKIDWTVWETGIEKIEGKNFSISLWSRNVAHDLFQGEFCNSCISLTKENARANLQYLSDFNFSMIEIYDKVLNKTIGHVTMWISKVKKDGAILVLNGIQVHRKYEKNGVEIRDLIFEYAKQFSRKLQINQIVLGQNGFNAIDTLNAIDVAFQPKYKSVYKQLDSENEEDDDNLINRDDMKFNIISPTFAGEMYSDIYSNKWIKTDKMEDIEFSNVFDISYIRKLSIHQLTNNELQEKLKNYEIWIIEYYPCNKIKISKQDKLILIENEYWETHKEGSLYEAYKIINPNFTPAFWKDHKEIPSELTIKSEDKSNKLEFK